MSIIEDVERHFCRRRPPSWPQQKTVAAPVSLSFSGHHITVTRLFFPEHRVTDVATWLLHFASAPFWLYCGSTLDP